MKILSFVPLAVLLVVSSQSVSLCGAASDPSGPGQAAAPDFGPNVLIFDPSMTNIQSRMDPIYDQQRRSQFGHGRYAYLFKPGQYNLDVQIGYYMQVLGLGQTPDSVAITGAVRSRSYGGALVSFWRGAENLSVAPTVDRGAAIWSVSQATDLRRIHVKGNLNLSDGGYSSGGYLADCIIDGQVNSGSQQQWLCRNAQLGGWNGGVWNMVFVGVVNPPAGAWPGRPFTVVEKTPVIREKPYLFVDDGGHYFVMVPRLKTNGSQGVSWAGGNTSGAIADSTPGLARATEGARESTGRPIAIDQFYLAQAGKDTADTINAALSSGKNLILTPGEYHLDKSIRITRPDTVALGLGFPTLTPDKGTPAMEISDVDGVKLGGIIFEGGASNSATLLQVGEPGSSASHAKDPTCLYDIHGRTGGAAAGTATSMVTINSSDVVGDHSWFWRADHGGGVGWAANACAHGLVVNGNNVTFYGLFVEHCQEYQTLWNGNGGRVYFYQSEMPYDPPNQEAWRHGAVNGYASYKVADTVKTHEAWGLGVYCVFNRAPVLSDAAIETPTAPGIRMHHLVAIRLGGQRGSGISHVLNSLGTPVVTTMKATLD